MMTSAGALPYLIKREGWSFVNPWQHDPLYVDLALTCNNYVALSVS